MKNNGQISDMRDILFNQLQKLADPNINVEKEALRTESMVAVCNTMVASAKVEVDFMKLTGSAGSGFIPISAPMQPGNDKLLTDGSR